MRLVAAERKNSRYQIVIHNSNVTSTILLDIILYEHFVSQHILILFLVFSSNIIVVYQAAYVNPTAHCRAPFIKSELKAY